VLSGGTGGGLSEAGDDEASSDVDGIGWHCDSALHGWCCAVLDTCDSGNVCLDLGDLRRNCLFLLYVLPPHITSYVLLLSCLLTVACRQSF
jgi:hypothetical protein